MPSQFQEKKLSNVLQFKPRQQQAVPAQESQPVPQAAPVTEMLTQSAAMTVIATLAFYAEQGFDHGAKARAAFPALKELLATKGVDLQFAE